MKNGNQLEDISGRKTCKRSYIHPFWKKTFQLHNWFC